MSGQYNTIILLLWFVLWGSPSQHKKALFMHRVWIYVSVHGMVPTVLIYHVTSDTRPAPFSACNIEKVGGAWGRGYIMLTSFEVWI